MKLTPRRAEANETHENPYWISFSDLMSALLLVFILAVVVLVLQLMQKQEDLSAQQQALQEQRELFTGQIGTLQEAELVRDEMLMEIKKDLQAQGIEVTVSENNTVLSIPSALLGFDAESFVIKKEYEDVSLAIGEAISEVITKDNRAQYLDTVFVEGHTDDLAFHGLEGTGNWGLSTFRAISLWTLWDESLPAKNQLDTLASADGTPLFSVSGYGETRPANARQNSESKRATNRRIDVRFTIVRPSSEDLLEIEQHINGEANQ